MARFDIAETIDTVGCFFSVSVVIPCLFNLLNYLVIVPSRSLRAGTCTNKAG